jgi:hypothetical protein
MDLEKMRFGKHRLDLSTNAIKVNPEESQNC